MKKTSQAPTVFISYNWTSSAHMKWVKTLADRLIGNGVNALLDVYEVEPGDSLTAFINNIASEETDFVLMICDCEYARKANQGRDTLESGVELETQIIFDENGRQMKQTKAIALIKEYTADGKPCLPEFMKERIYLDFSSEEKATANWEDLFKLLFDIPKNQKPPLGALPEFIFPKPAAEKSPAEQLAELNELADIAEGIGAYRDELKYRQKIWNIVQKDPDQAAQADTLNNLGNAETHCGEYTEALNHLEQSLAILIKLYGENHPHTAISYNNIGNLYRNKGEYDRALEYLHKALTIRLKVLGENHPDTAGSYNNIGSVYWNKGDYDRALEADQKALTIRLEVLGENHPDTASSYNNIGNVYDNKGEHDRALEAYHKALTIWLKVRGEHHPDTAVSYNNIGVIYLYKGEYDRALEFFQKDLDISRKVHGENHPDTATSYNNIGAAYADKGEYDRALEYLHKALTIRLKVFGENHPHTQSLQSKINLIKGK